MILDEIQRAWDSPANAPSPAVLEKQRAEFTRGLGDRYRVSVVAMVLVAAVLAHATGRVLYQMLATNFGLPKLEGDPIHLWTEWSVVLFLAIPWTVLVVSLRLHLRHRREHPDYDQSFGASLRAMADANRSAFARLKTNSILLLAALPVMLLLFYQLRAAGKTRGHELVSALVVCAASGLVIGGVLAYQYFRLVPERTRLEDLLRFYGASEAGSPPGGHDD